MYLSTKTYGHSAGLSACFRQHRASSHCRFLHGYALSVKLTFETTTLDDRNWVVDFGSLKPVKAWLQETFDHKTIIAEDDPQRGEFERLAEIDLVQLVVLPAVGCEAFAEHIGRWVIQWLADQGLSQRVVLRSVEVAEHEANSAIWEAAHA